MQKESEKSCKKWFLFGVCKGFKNLPLISMEKSSSDGAEQMLMIEPEIEIRKIKKVHGRRSNSDSSVHVHSVTVLWDMRKKINI